MAASYHFVVCGIAPASIYLVLIIAVALISRDAKYAPIDQLASASFIDIHDAAGQPFLIVVPTVEPSLTASLPLARALDVRASCSAVPALQLGGQA